MEELEIKNVKVPMIYEENKDLPIVSFRFVMRCSGHLEDGEKAGLCSVSAKILEEGTKKIDAVSFAKKLEDKAIEFNVASESETMVIGISSLKESFEYGLKMLNKVLKNPNFSNEALSKIKTLTLGQISDSNSDFDYIAQKNLKKLLHKGTPLENPIIGHEESIKQIQLEDVEDFINTHIDLSNAIIVIGGDLNKNEAKKYAKRVLKNLKVGVKREYQRFETSQDEKEFIEKKQSEQAYIYFGSPFDMKLDDEDKYKAKVSSFILGSSGFGSRLMEEIRVKNGLAYSVYSYILMEYSCSKFSGYMQTKNENLEKSVKLLKQVINQFVKNGVTQSELNQAKKFLLGSEPLRNETLRQRLGKAYVEFYKGFGIGYGKKELALIEQLELEDLNDFIKKHSEIEKLTFSIVTNEDK